MSYLPSYKKSDFKGLSWGEYGKTLKTLYKRVSDYITNHNIKIDAIVPILRGGAFPGVYLAYKLHILRVLPIQYHYQFKNGKAYLRRILWLPDKTLGLPESSTFLVVEGNRCFGLTGQTAVNDIKKAFPKSKILYAADHMDYSYRDIKGAEAVFWGKLTNETRKLSPEQARKKGIKNPYSDLFPWEDIDEEWATVQCQQFKYQDLDVLDSSEVKEEIDL